MAKVATVEEKRVEEAISSLYDLFPSVSTRYNDCPDIKTKEVKALNRKIVARDKELKKMVETDKDIIALRKERKKLVCETAEKANALHLRVDVLRRKFQLHGITPELIKEIDQLAAMPPILSKIDCTCGEDDYDS